MNKSLVSISRHVSLADTAIQKKTIRNKKRECISQSNLWSMLPYITDYFSKCNGERNRKSIIALKKMLEAEEKQSQLVWDTEN